MICASDRRSAALDIVAALIDAQEGMSGGQPEGRSRRSRLSVISLFVMSIMRRVFARGGRKPARGQNKCGCKGREEKYGTAKMGVHHGFPAKYVVVTDKPAPVRCDVRRRY